MSEQGRGHWDRSSDLELVRAAYSHYGASGRARLWDERNRGYNRLADDLGGRLLRVLQRSVDQSGRRVIDLGCGTGALAGLAAEYGIPTEWIGVDLRADAIAEARAAHPEATFMTASADDVPLATASADVVIAQLLFSSLPSRELEFAVAREVERLLRPGGWLVWVDIRYSNPWNPAVHGISAELLTAMFSGWRQQLHSTGLLPPIARRLGVITPAAYPALSAIPFLRSHLVGRLGRPISVNRG